MWKFIENKKLQTENGTQWNISNLNIVHTCLFVNSVHNDSILKAYFTSFRI